MLKRIKQHRTLLALFGPNLRITVHDSGTAVPAQHCILIFRIAFRHRLSERIHGFDEPVIGLGTGSRPTLPEMEFRPTLKNKAGKIGLTMGSIQFGNDLPGLPKRGIDPKLGKFVGQWPAAGFSAPPGVPVPPLKYPGRCFPPHWVHSAVVTVGLWPRLSVPLQPL